MRRRRAGFTFVEVLTAMTIIAILAGIVLPKTGDFIKQARAAVAVGDIRVVQDGIASFYVDSLSYPATGALGQVPPSLRPYVGENFSFVRNGYQLQYNRWVLWTMLSGRPSTLTIIGVTVNTRDARLGQLVTQRMSSTPHFQWGNNYTFIVIGL